MSAFSILIISKNPTASGFLFKLIKLKEKFKKILMAKKCLASFIFYYSECKEKLALDATKMYLIQTKI